mgnify:CR=1 FL=1
MSFQIMKKAMIGAAGAVALMGAVSAQALTLTPATADGQSYTFAGTTELSLGGLSATCGLSITGFIDAASETINVTNNSVTGAFPCNTVEIDNFDVGDVSNVDSNGGQVTFNGLDVTVGFLFSCNNGTVTADFVNDGANPSYFTIPSQSFGSCSLETTTPLAIDPVSSYSTDVNVSP